MRLLLDTHVWLWGLLEPERLPAAVAAELRSDRHRLWLSPISVWETLVLIEKGRLRIDGAPERWVRDALRASPVREASLNHEVALRSRRLRLPHEDPADRFIAATALVYDLVLVTADTRLAGHEAEGLRVLAGF